MRGEETRTEIHVTDDDLPENGSEMKGTNENRIGKCHLKWWGILKMFPSKWKKEEERTKEKQKKPNSRQYKMLSEKTKLKWKFGAVHSRLRAHTKSGIFFSFSYNSGIQKDAQTEYKTLMFR